MEAGHTECFLEFDPLCRRYGTGKALVENGVVAWLQHMVFSKLSFLQAAPHL